MTIRTDSDRTIRNRRTTGLRSDPKPDPTDGRTDGLTKKYSPTVEILQLGHRARKPKPNPTMTAPLTRQLEPRRQAVTCDVGAPVTCVSALPDRTQK